jgi:DNA-binding response OmpR family regulator
MTRKVMIVDDDPGVRISVETVFRRAGFEVESAEGGAECLKKLEAGFRGVVLMDVMMPEMDGWDTIRALDERGFARNVVLLMLTAREEPDAKMDGLQQLVVDYLTKPFEPDELIRTVEDLLEYLN